MEMATASQAAGPKGLTGEAGDRRVRIPGGSARGSAVPSGHARDTVREPFRGSRPVFASAHQTTGPSRGGFPDLFGRRVGDPFLERLLPPRLLIRGAVPRH